MSFSFWMAVEHANLEKHFDSRAAIAAGGLHKAAGLAGNQVKDRWRAAVTGGGLGQRLANTIRASVYPRSGSAKSMSPAASVWTRAPHILRVHTEGATIRRSSGGVYLWIPTENVPRRGSNQPRMTPTQVEERFGDFVYIPSLTRPGVVMATVEGVTAKNKAGWRQQKAGAKRKSRNAVRIVMFVLVRQVSLRKRYDFGAVESWAQSEWPDIVSRSLVEAFRNDEGGA